jgi:hypothetical protein
MWAGTCIVEIQMDDLKEAIPDETAILRVVSDIAAAIVASEDGAGCGRGRMGSEIARAVLIGRQTSRDGVQHNVYKMPFSTVENQTRYRN